MSRLIYILIFIVLLTGCAEEVQKKNAIPEATEMTITIYFRGNVDSTLYKYYMVFAKESGIRLPNVSLANPYFLRPGEPIDTAKLQTFVIVTDNISYYYENFYYTWGEVTRFQTGAHTVVRGPFPGTANVAIHDSYTDTGIGLFPVQDTTAGEVLQIKFSVTALQSYVKSNRLYFNFVSVDRGAVDSGLLYDYLDSEPSIQCISGAEMNEYDSSDDSAKPAGADIIKWSVRIK